MNEFTASRQIPLLVWLTAGLWLLFGIFGTIVHAARRESNDFMNWFRVLGGLLIWTILAVRLLRRASRARQVVLFMGGVLFPFFGALLLTWHLQRLTEEAHAVPQWVWVSSGIIFIVGIWHWWALTRPAVREWFASTTTRPPVDETQGPNGVGQGEEDAVRSQERT
jgi:hypothetical protein